MKKQLLKDFRLNARALAENSWGRDGTNSARTNTKGAYYYGCSGHGGYVVNGSVFTQAQRENIEKYVKPEQHCLIAIATDRDVTIGKEYVIGVSYPNSSQRSYRVPCGLRFVEWRTADVYLFEEDCAWSVLEKFTDIRLTHDKKVDNSVFLKAREEQIEKCFKRWYLDRK